MAAKMLRAPIFSKWFSHKKAQLMISAKFLLYFFSSLWKEVPFIWPSNTSFLYIYRYYKYTAKNVDDIMICVNIVDQK